MPLPRFRARARRVGSTFLAVVMLATTVALPAAATPQTILRGLGNVVMSPLDAALAPVSTFVGIRQNLQDIDDSPGVRLFYPIPAYFYAVGIQLGCSWIRLTSGLMEVGVGALVLPFETDIDPLFGPSEDAAALVEIDIDYMDSPLRFGVNYTQSGG